MYQILQKCDIHWHVGGPSIAMIYHPRTGLRSALWLKKMFSVLYERCCITLFHILYVKWNSLSSSSSSSSIYFACRCQSGLPSTWHNANSDLSDMAELPPFSPPASKSTLEYRTSPLWQAGMRPKLKAAPVYILSIAIISLWWYQFYVFSVLSLNS